MGHKRQSDAIKDKSIGVGKRLPKRNVTISGITIDDIIIYSYLFLI
jgi:hypothetical protein